MRRLKLVFCKSKIVERHIRGNVVDYVCQFCRTSCDTIQQVNETHKNYEFKNLKIENGLVTVITEADFKSISHHHSKDTDYTTPLKEVAYI